MNYSVVHTSVPSTGLIVKIGFPSNMTLDLVGGSYARLTKNGDPPSTNPQGNIFFSYTDIDAPTLDLGNPTLGLKNMVVLEPYEEKSNTHINLRGIPVKYTVPKTTEVVIIIFPYFAYITPIPQRERPELYTMTIKMSEGRKRFYINMNDKLNDDYLRDLVSPRLLDQASFSFIDLGQYLNDKRVKNQRKLEEITNENYTINAALVNVNVLK